MNLENRIEVVSVSAFLDAVKQIYCDKDHQLFYRGVSKKAYFKTPSLQYKSKPQYIAQQYACLIIGNETIKKSFYSLEKAKSLVSEQSNDHPGVFRKKDTKDDNSEKWVVDEDRMFYDLVARCPEYFKDCKTTFEHLVMMQHYGYPTRLLDITSNPLVALYFACGGLNGSNSEDGQLISYHIKKNDIRNYESDRVSLLSNLSRAKVSFTYLCFLINERIDILKSLLSSDTDGIHWSVLKDKDRHILMPIILKALPTYLLRFDNVTFNGVNEPLSKAISSTNEAIQHLQSWSSGEYNLSFPQFELICKNAIQIAEFNLNQSAIHWNSFKNEIKKEKSYFTCEKIISQHLKEVQCVLPKQNNPRLIAQQGAFLLFGFKDALSDKTATPIVPDEMYGRAKASDNSNSGEKIKIIIKGSEKQKILDELKILGISNSTMFPEIDNIANELKNQYTKL